MSPPQRCQDIVRAYSTPLLGATMILNVDSALSFIKNIFIENGICLGDASRQNALS